MNPEKITGIIPPLVTPLTNNQDLDPEALAKLIEHVLAGGVNGVFLLGSIGENASLTDDTRRQVITASIKAVSKRIPVLVNITSSSYKDSLQLADYAGEQGADYVVLALPFYYNMNQDELINYAEMIADKVPIPMILYNAPQYIKTGIDPESVEKLSKHKNIVGIKDSSGNMAGIHELLGLIHNNDFSILVGPEMLLGEGVLNGCDGGINGGANIFPKLFVKMYEAAVKRDIEKMLQLQEWIRKIQKNIYQAADSPVRMILGIKYALSIKGICSARMAMPVYADLTNNKKKIIKDFVKEFEEFDI